MQRAVRRACVFVALALVMPAVSTFRANASSGNPEEAARPPASSTTPTGNSVCPRPEEVWAEVETLIPRERLTPEQPSDKDQPAPAWGSGPSSSQLEIMDLGTRYQVIIGGHVREYKDDARDCNHRARVAAVFVALSLAPAYFGHSPVEAPPKPDTVARTQPAAPQLAPPDRHGIWVTAAASYAAGLSTDHHRAFGIALRLDIARAFWGFTGGITFPLTSDGSVNGLRVTERRIPADVGVRAALYAGIGTQLTGEAGASVARISETAPDLASVSTPSGIEWGIRAGLTLRLAVTSRVAPFVGAHFELVPRPASLWAIPQGRAGRTPLAWVGLACGGSFGW